MCQILLRLVQSHKLTESIKGTQGLFQGLIPPPVFDGIYELRETGESDGRVDPVRSMARGKVRTLLMSRAGRWRRAYMIIKRKL